MQNLIDGVLKFQREVLPRERALFENLAHGQNPSTLFITCADSRIDPTLITQQMPGELFICRNAGNMVPAFGEMTGGVSATIEYAVVVLEVRNIIICGHSDCGAMKALMHPEKLDDLPVVKNWLAHGEVARQIVRDSWPDLPAEGVQQAITEQNVVAQIQHLRTFPSVASRLMRGLIQVHGWIYSIPTGEVTIWSPDRNRFIPLEQHSLTSTTWSASSGYRESRAG